jgi:hypothetical protein
MAVLLKLSSTARSAACDAVVDLADTGYIRIYDGTRATDPQTAIGAQVLLAELRFGATAFGAASAGVATANAITQDSSANATGTATWARILKSDGTTVLWDCNVGTATADIIMATVSIVSAAVVTITAMTYTQPE